jgi:uroporphyrinogen III methyltransferase / synthase
VVETDTSPLAGKRVVITRAALQSADLSDKLRGCGAIPVLLPLVKFAPPEDYAPLDAALLQWKRFNWVMFTSAYAMQAVTARAARFGRNLAKAGAPPNVAVVGPATREKAERAGFSVAYTARTHVGVALAEELGERLKKRRVLLPRSDRANPDLPSALRRMGAEVTEVVAYRTVRPSDGDQDLVARVAKGDADAILFFSPSAVHTFIELVGRERLNALQARTVMASIGPVTAAALRKAGIQRIVVPAEATADAVVGALESHFATSKRFSAGAKPA